MQSTRSRHALPTSWILRRKPAESNPCRGAVRQEIFTAKDGGPLHSSLACGVGLICTMVL